MHTSMAGGFFGTSVTTSQALLLLLPIPQLVSAVRRLVQITYISVARFAQKSSSHNATTPHVTAATHPTQDRPNVRGWSARHQNYVGLRKRTEQADAPVGATICSPPVYVQLEFALEVSTILHVEPMGWFLMKLVCKRCNHALHAV